MRTTPGTARPPACTATATRSRRSCTRFSSSIRSGTTICGPARRASQSWDAAGLATPLVLSADEFARSLDAFPFELSAILADHTVVSGKNPFEGHRVEPADLRRACEVQARSHLLHLREGYLETRGRADALAVLVVRSADAWVSLLQNIVRLEGLAGLDRAAAGRHVERALNLTSGVEDVVKLVGVKEISSAEALRLFPPYLDAAERLTKYVDQWRGATQ